ncbi:oxygenase MpaB family protein [Longimicrobium sp.]|uniref:oxygenase MpaB family protein n=1 Tax=Longimicrobium sp. TaxID=2029185 RepID=UPI002C162D3E|nr:oxygenase MpaB family protein [Longimicrobium sp.]HSU17365.1 oxygenase MpaB family protein [Longimicrobium sp.]
MSVLMTRTSTPVGARSGSVRGDACLLEAPVSGGAVADFVDQSSIVRRIWGDGDMVLLVFAGSAAEFALNRAVDWLFFTGKLPGDPIGRLFSTASYAQGIVFADAATAARTLGRIRAVHQAVERQRGRHIPDWAHRDVLYMLIDYSERAHEMFARPLSADERRELYDVFYRVGTGLGIPDLPPAYDEWRADRELHLRRDLVHGEGTEALYAQYRKHLGPWRYHLLLRLQAILTPGHVRGLLRLKRAEWLRPLLRFYPVLVRAGLRSIIQRLLMPPAYLAAVRALDQPAASLPEPRTSPAGDARRADAQDGRHRGGRDCCADG